MYPEYISDTWIEQFIKAAIAEDKGPGDYSTLSCIPEAAQGTAQLIIKDEGILAGCALVKKIFAFLDKNIIYEEFITDGSFVSPTEVAFKVHGSVHSILLAERLVLNCMQRMSGIATVTNLFIKQVAGTKAKILDTRKTTPTIRPIERWAVLLGGGQNHRFGLFDMVLLKDNHIDYAGGIAKAIESTLSFLEKNNLNLKIEIETRSLEEVKQVLKAGRVNRILLDNMDNKTLVSAVKMINGVFETEASGGINLYNVRNAAEAGVDYISIGALTHSYKSMDLSLKAIRK